MPAPVGFAALIPIIAAIAPMAASAIGSALGGGKGKEIAVSTANAVTEAVQEVFGTTNQDEISRLAKEDPAKAAEFRVRMSELSFQVRMKEIEGHFGDLADARNMANQTPLIARTQVGLAWATTAMFAAALVAASVLPVYRVPDILMGALIYAWADVRGFFFGGSTSAHSANSTMASLAGRAVNAVQGLLPGAAAAPASVASVTDKTYMERTVRTPMEDTPGAAERLNQEQRP